MGLPPKRRRRLPARWADGISDLHDYYEQPPRVRRNGRRPPTDDGPVIVSDDWPARIPITDDELRVIEGYLRRELDELFGPLP